MSTNKYRVVALDLVNNLRANNELTDYDYRISENVTIKWDANTKQLCVLIPEYDKEIFRDVLTSRNITWKEALDIIRHISYDY